jgi:hypothetical protein
MSADHNWVEVTGLSPDRTYPYRVLIDGWEAGRGEARTFPERSNRLSFFVIGDYGTGKPPQFEIAQVMLREFQKRAASDSPVRFVVTNGDNIYEGIFGGDSGAEDRDWRTKFFEPYEELLRQIPFYPTLGNHDRGASVGQPDAQVATYLDNFFLPIDDRLPYYTFSFGGLADFFALDSTVLSPLPPFEHSLAPEGGQFHWLETALSRSSNPWKIAYFHHAPFNAGPGHGDMLAPFTHVIDLFRTHGVQVVFSGHEHNFQFAGRNSATGNTLYVVSGAGGQVRTASVYSDMAAANIVGVAAQHHFLLVEIEGRTMRITPLSSAPIIVRDKDRRPLPMPLVIENGTLD